MGMGDLSAQELAQRLLAIKGAINDGEYAVDALLWFNEHATRVDPGVLFSGGMRLSAQETENVSKAQHYVDAACAEAAPQILLRALALARADGDAASTTVKENLP